MKETMYGQGLEAFKHITTDEIQAAVEKAERSKEQRMFSEHDELIEYDLS
ncbi:hypothetical protein LCGC14_2705060, partial [marine sediment metagenome]